MKALIVEDETSLQCFLEYVLKAEFTEIVIAENGQVALDILAEAKSNELPHIILMDVVMPVMDGFEAAKRVRELYPEKYLPIVFLTGITDADAFDRCMTFGDDFLTKPIVRNTLVAKVRAHCRNIKLYREVSIQHDRLKHFQDRTIYEHTMAEEIFSNLMQGCYNKAKGVSFYTSSYNNFNGDVVLVSKRPQGGVYVMIADATGHGLPAAISSIPATKTFIAMTASGHALGDIASEMNSHLKSFLPPGMLMAANLFEVASNGLDVNWWGGGMPDGYIFDENGEILHRLSCEHMALGALEKNEFEANVVRLALKPGQRLFFFTDGVIEARSPEGKELGEDGFESAIRGCRSNAIGKTIELIDSYAGGKGIGDDLSMLELTFPVSSGEDVDKDLKDVYLSRAASKTELEFEAEELKTSNLIAEARRLVKGAVGSNIDLDLMCTVISELLNNALEHGILGLDSKTKESDDGFIEYYLERQKRLDNLADDAFISIHFQFIPRQRKVILRLAHSGNGFDYMQTLNKASDDELRSGRGVSLVTELCESLSYSDEGRVVVAEFVLQAGLDVIEQTNFPKAL